MPAYQDLEAIFTRAAILQDVVGILGWDTETMMPGGAIEGRSEQLAMLEGMAHDTLTAEAVGELIAASAGQTGLSDWQLANLREMQRIHLRALAVPRDLLIASTKAAALCRHAWQSARKDNDFAAVKGRLAEVVKLQRETGAALGAALDLGPYDALLDQYDIGSTADVLDRLFAPLRPVLPGLVQSAVEKQRSGPEIIPLEGPFPIETQERLCRDLLNTIGFDFNHGRLDVSAHPFTGGASGDVRITTRFSDAEFLSSLMAAIHEGGHALYEQGRPKEWWTQPVGRARGTSTHESQALIMERQAARGPEFLSYLEPLLREAFGGSGAAWSADNLRRIALQVKPGFIRVDADEVTYPAHVLLRYELEKAMINGDLAIDDLPGAFNAAIKEFLGLDVPDDRRGCLQDIHWYSGAFGYFPTYLVGAMTAAQLFDAATDADAGLKPGLARGDFQPLVGWLRANIHVKASLLDWQDLIVAATGAPLGSAKFIGHLQNRYLS